MWKPRHKCCICWKVRYEEKMEKVFNSSWACKNDYIYPIWWVDCTKDKEIFIVKEIIQLKKNLKKLSSYV